MVFLGASILNPSLHTVKDAKTEGGRHQLEKEVETLSLLPRHPNIAAIVDAFTSEDGTIESLVYEYHNGSLQSLIYSQEYLKTTVDLGFAFLKDISAAIVFAHKNGICHNNIRVFSPSLRSNRSF